MLDDDDEDVSMGCCKEAVVSATAAVMPPFTSVSDSNRSTTFSISDGQVLL